MEDGFERAFWSHVSGDPLNYYFFTFDWKRRRDRTKILLAMGDQKIKGSMLLYAGRVIQLRGERKAVELLLDSVDYENVELQAPLDCEDLVLSRYKPSFRHTLMLMRLNRGEEKLQVRHTPSRLGANDAGEIVELLRKADPAVWSNIDPEEARLNWADAYLLGMRRHGRLVSTGSTRFVEGGSNIGVIATDEAHRNRGFATSIVSALAREILEKSPPALIHVLKDNAPAVHVYSKVGFKPCKEYLMIRGEKIKA
jgi:ribosomal protein S18 acetylase RimI-like enzyme